MKRRSFAAFALGSSAIAVALTFGVGACQIGEEAFPPNAGPSATITSVTVAPTILRFGDDDEQPGSEGCLPVDAGGSVVADADTDASDAEASAPPVATDAGRDADAAPAPVATANACTFTVTVNYTFPASTTFVSRATVSFEAVGAPQTFSVERRVNAAPELPVTLSLPVTLPPTLIQRGDHDFTVRLITNTGAISLPVTAAIGVR